MRQRRHHRGGWRGRGRGGFTLVELMVAIAIIGVLIAILLPTIRRARAQALLVHCQTQIRSQLQAHAVYSTDWKDVKPPFYATSGVMTFGGWLMPTVRWANIPVGQGILVANGYLPLEVLLDNKDHLEEDAYNDLWQWSNSTMSGSSYFYFWKHPNDLMGNITYQRCWTSGNKALILETNSETNLPFNGVMPSGGWTAHPIVNRMNAGFADGSVQSFPADEVRLRNAGGTNANLRLLDYYQQANGRFGSP